MRVVAELLRLVELGRERCVGVEGLGCFVEAAERGVGVDGVAAAGGEQDRATEGGGVDADGAVVGEDEVGGGDGGAPALVGRDQEEAGAEGFVEPRLDLALTVRGPDIGVQDEREAVFIVRESGEEPWYERGVGPEKGIGLPGGIDGDEFLSGAQAEIVAVVEPPRRAGE
ncbi:hypothetical protein [Nocardiopsis nanhaiensis]